MGGFTVGSECFTPWGSSVRNGLSCKSAARIIGCAVSKVGDRVWKHERTWSRLTAADPVRSQATLVEAIYRLRGRRWPYAFDPGGWLPREVEESLGLVRGTGRQTLFWASETIARLMLADPASTMIDLFEAMCGVMSDREIDRRERMLTGRIDRSEIHPAAERAPCPQNLPSQPAAPCQELPTQRAAV